MSHRLVEVAGLLLLWLLVGFWRLVKWMFVIGLIIIGVAIAWAG